MKDDLSKNRDFKMNWSGLGVFMEHWVDLGIKTWKNGEKYTFWAFFDDLYRYTLNLYRYSHPELNLYRYRSYLYRYTLLYFDQCSYFNHNVNISYPI